MAETPQPPYRYGKLLKRVIAGKRLTQGAFANRIREATGVRVTQARLNLIIHGKDKVPLHWCAAITETFGLTEIQRQQLNAAAAADHGLQVDIPSLPK